MKPPFPAILIQYTGEPFCSVMFRPVVVTGLFPSTQTATVELPSNSTGGKIVRCVHYDDLCSRRELAAGKMATALAGLINEHLLVTDQKTAAAETAGAVAGTNSTP